MECMQVEEKCFQEFVLKSILPFFLLKSKKKNTFHMIIIKKNDYSIPALLLE